jgi:hypothetical protein
MDIINFPEHLFDNNYTDTPTCKLLTTRRINLFPKIRLT